MMCVPSAYARGACAVPLRESRHPGTPIASEEVELMLFLLGVAAGIVIALIILFWKDMW